ncbi:hypothetical protein GCM10027290_27290 [Micromonospora sonneratiae]
MEIEEHGVDRAARKRRAGIAGGFARRTRLGWFEMVRHAEHPTDRVGRDRSTACRVDPAGTH